MDILFDGTTHTVKKFILWTNMPNQPFFTRYEKCHFRIGRPAHLAVSAGDILADMSPFVEIPPAPKEDAAPPADQPPVEEDDIISSNSDISETEVPEVNPDMTVHNTPQACFENGLPLLVLQFEQIAKVFGAPIGKPFMAPGALDSPFGGQHNFYAYKDIIFEVMDNGYVSKVILFKST